MSLDDTRKPALVSNFLASLCNVSRISFVITVDFGRYVALYTGFAIVQRGKIKSEKEAGEKSVEMGGPVVHLTKSEA
jgi:hypothetical protein